MTFRPELVLGEVNFIEPYARFFLVAEFVTPAWELRCIIFCVYCRVWYRVSVWSTSCRDAISYRELS